MCLRKKNKTKENIIKYEIIFQQQSKQQQQLKGVYKFFLLFLFKEKWSLVKIEPLVRYFQSKILKKIFFVFFSNENII